MDDFYWQYSSFFSKTVQIWKNVKRWTEEVVENTVLGSISLSCDNWRLIWCSKSWENGQIFRYSVIEFWSEQQAMWPHF